MIISELSEKSLPIADQSKTMGRDECITHIQEMIREMNQEIQTEEKPYGTPKAHFVYLKLALYHLKHEKVAEAIQALEHCRFINPYIKLNDLITSLELDPSLKKVNKVKAFFENHLKKISQFLSKPILSSQSKLETAADLKQEKSDSGPQNMTYLNYENSPYLTDDDLTKVAKQYPNLISISLSFCYKVTDVGIQALAEQCPHLSWIDLSFCDRITSVGIDALTQKHPNIEIVL